MLVNSEHTMYDCVLSVLQPAVVVKPLPIVGFYVNVTNNRVNLQKPNAPDKPCIQ